MNAPKATTTATVFDATITSQIVESKLPFEQEHLDALSRMQSLAPYYQWSVELIAPWIGQRVLDAGCGIGNATEHLKERAEYVLAADLSPKNLQVLQKRFAEAENVEPAQLDLDKDIHEITSRKIDTIVCLDVLEHVEDDCGLLMRFNEMLQPGGHLLIKVPAGRWLFGSIDEASGHFRRYTKSELRQKAQRCGWDVIKLHYMNIFGVLPYFIKSRVLKKRANFSRTMSRKQLERIRKILPVLKRIDRFIGPPLGQSLVLVARKQPENGT